MRTRKDPRNGDPRLKTKEWKAIRKAWLHLQPETCQATPCLMPGTPIQYEGKRGPAHLDVGHKIPRALDTRRTWTINDTRPEHAHCGQSHGTQIKKQINNTLNNTRINKQEQAKSATKW